MPGRTLNRWTRVYADGRDLSGFSRSVGPLVADMQPADITAPMADAAHGFLPEIPVFTPTSLNALLDNTATSGLQAVMSGAGVGRNILVAIGDRAAPAIGAPVFAGAFIQQTYDASDFSNGVAVNMAFSDFDEILSAGWNYSQVWGNLLHPMGNETAVDSANTNVDGGASTSLGGILIYHITSITGSGTVTLSMDDSASGSGSWLATAGATTTAIATATAPTAGFVALSHTATIRQFTRWQLAFGGSATGCTFGLAFIRGV